MSGEDAPQLLIISGRSGSGKSVALRQLEDAGYYCVDNLPASLLEQLIQATLGDSASPHRKVAVSIDARNVGEDTHAIVKTIQRQKKRWANIAIHYLDAVDEILVRRFKETRRRHPLSSSRVSLKQAIEWEDKLLEPLRENASLLIDTSATNLHQFRQSVIERIVKQDGFTEIALRLISFGYKNGLPIDADMVFDARCLSNPYWREDLRHRDGRDSAVRAYLDKNRETGEMRDTIGAFISNWLPAFQRENRHYLSIAIGCTGGQHRSVYLCEELATRFRRQLGNVSVQHRELAD